jgi:hypothetical protein
MSRGGAGNTNDREDRYKVFGGTEGKQIWEIQGFKWNISVKVIMVNTGNVGVGWSGLFESWLYQKGFQNFHFLLMKIPYCSDYGGCVHTDATSL